MKKTSLKAFLILFLSITAVILAPCDRSAAGVQANLSEMMGNNRALREELLKDPYRPGYHFVAWEGGDVNGAIFWKGRYHLFYIFGSTRIRVGKS